jgi:hypothetical protein
MRHSFAIALALATHATFVAAQTISTTRLIPYAGTVTDSSGAAIAGAVNLTFELYEEQEGGVPLWREDQRVHADDRGRYLVYLGSAVAMPQIAFSEERARWLAVAIEGHALPRVMLVAVPYALRAADADTLGGQPASSFVRSRADGRLETDAGLVADAAVEGTGVAGQLAKWVTPDSLSSSVISESATNRIGVGLPDPTGAGVVDSVFTIRNFDNNTGFAVLNQSQQRRFALNTLSTGAWTLYDGGNNIWNQGLTQVGGRVGLGTTTPLGASAAVSGKLSVAAANENAIFARKGAGDSFRKAIHARSDIGIAGPIIAGIAGVQDIIDYGANAGVLGVNFTTNGYGVFGWAGTTGAGVYGTGTTAGEFSGNVNISGTLTKGGGAFQIDHPLDPANKYLRHSFVESPDMMNIYNGNVTLDAVGEAWITLPDWFEALNRDFRYQLTAVGAPGPNLHVAAKVSGGRFKIAGGSPSAEVSWQITGVRQDAWANANRIVVEDDKKPEERGYYLHPEVFELPARMAVPSMRAHEPAVTASGPGRTK